MNAPLIWTIRVYRGLKWLIYKIFINCWWLWLPFAMGHHVLTNAKYKRVCAVQASVVEIVRVDHRTAYARMSTGTIERFSQPSDLVVGKSYCLKYKNVLRDTENKNGSAR